MKHPNIATLALHAGDDLDRLASWRVERHLRHCGECRDEVAAHREVREVTTDLAEIPEVQWNRLAAEMKANIRLGVAAGECVRVTSPAAPVHLFRGARALVAVGSVLTLMVTGLVLEHPGPSRKAVQEQGVVVQKMANGIQVWADGRALLLKDSGGKDVMYSVGAQGSMRARYVDSETGNVTINNVYAE